MLVITIFLFLLFKSLLLIFTHNPYSCLSKLSATRTTRYQDLSSDPEVKRMVYVPRQVCILQSIRSIFIHLLIYLSSRLLIYFLFVCLRSTSIDWQEDLIVKVSSNLRLSCMRCYYCSWNFVVSSYSLSWSLNEFHFMFLFSRSVHFMGYASTIRSRLRKLIWLD